MKIICHCDNRKEYEELKAQLREEKINFSATEQKHISEWWDEEDPLEEPSSYDYRIVFWYWKKLI